MNKTLLMLHPRSTINPPPPIMKSSRTLPKRSGRPTRPAALWLMRGLCLALLLGPATQQSTAANAAPPDFMTYQGYLVDANGDVLAPAAPANYPVIFRIFDASSGGAPLWSEQQVVTVDQGQFSVLLGEGTPVSGEPRPAIGSVFGGNTASDRYIGVAVTISGSTVEILPRLRLVTSPYAHLSTTTYRLAKSDGSTVLSHSNDRVQVIGDLDATGIISGDGSGLTSLTAGQIPNLDAGKITSGTLNANRIPNLDAGKIASGTLNASRIPNLDAGKITSGTLGANRIPNLSADKLTSGTVGDDRLSSNVAKLNRVNKFLANVEVDGDVKLGPGNRFQAASSLEKLRIIRGTVVAGAPASTGSGFVAARLAPGIYRITYTESFPATPTVTATVLQSPGAAVAVLGGASDESCEVRVLDLSFNPPRFAEYHFQFQVIGGR